MPGTDVILADKFPVVAYQEPYKLVEERVVFTNREDVQQQLPDICSRALARAWIDTEFYEQLEQDVLGTFRSQGVILPDNMTIQFDHSGKNRPKLIVYEQSEHNSKFKVRVCALTLTMMAQR